MFNVKRLVGAMVLLLVGSTVLFGQQQRIPNRINTNIPKQITLKVTYDDPTLWPAKENVPDPEHAFAVMFKDYVERMSAGKIKVELFGAGALGSYRQTCEMVQNGSIDINIGTGSLANWVKELQLLAIPYVFMSDDVA